jgi:hypothetical protein
MGLNPTILRQVRAFALPVTPSEPPVVHRRGYRASGLVLTSIRDIAQTSQMRPWSPFGEVARFLQTGRTVEDPYDRSVWIVVVGGRAY